jgi:hypothetical protein
MSSKSFQFAHRFSSTSTTPLTIEIPNTVNIASNRYIQRNGSDSLGAVGKFYLYGMDEDGFMYTEIFNFVWEHDSTNLESIAVYADFAPSVLNLFLENKFRIGITPPNGNIEWMVYIEGICANG